MPPSHLSREVRVYDARGIKYTARDIEFDWEGESRDPAKLTKVLVIGVTDTASNPRLVRVHDLWHQGFTLREIARSLDSTINSIGVTVTKMRREGWDMPYRNRPCVTAS